ncbi:hypothetical protein CROQUDRAFT_43991 [Cronartium quercuum f. sp. fusiforme G11]|uniref:Uncharacterized protein n=1 Tax=Cronartium quercuum f. sp. fusiforme G11 TaxID=708437 RepID=A0A9P6NGV2_9BASI|nr:hypothetical protein CROQUDRAFT_43991 [Cronartium quercuum f. sp. fusiforme G11]
MGLLTYTATWATVGFGVRIYQLGVMQRNLFENLGGHFLAAGLFGSAGYYFHGLKDRQREMLKIKREEVRQYQEAQKIRDSLREKIVA